MEMLQNKQTEIQATALWPIAPTASCSFSQDLVDQVNYLTFFFFYQVLSFYTVCDLHFPLRITEIYLDPLINQQTAKHDVTLKNIVS